MVEVIGPGEQAWRFPCSHWLGKSDAGEYVGARSAPLTPGNSVLALRVPGEFGVSHA